MISLKDYLGPWAESKDLSPQRYANACRLVLVVQGLLERMAQDGVVPKRNPKTKSVVSGSTFGGFRPQTCPIGAPTSKHKEALAVDLYDPDGAIDAWCMAHLDVLAEHGVYIEHPDDTPTWSHWQILPPKSGNRVFKP